MCSKSYFAEHLFYNSLHSPSLNSIERSYKRRSNFLIHSLYPIRSLLERLKKNGTVSSDRIAYSKPSSCKEEKEKAAFIPRVVCPAFQSSAHFHSKNLRHVFQVVLCSTCVLQLPPLTLPQILSNALIKEEATSRHTLFETFHMSRKKKKFLQEAAFIPRGMIAGNAIVWFL
ncbi:hypothetical protein CEXT_779681 [Caerostris extrusa]|uniref:Maturase K n=1 Tax=Caerostris extrusa TaxID=172846 RepID=A0AAV4VU51_CAEEX|nr:hypothetical protein CEXT_779681 [Caerostris extrusa]